MQGKGQNKKDIAADIRNKKELKDYIVEHRHWQYKIIRTESSPLQVASLYAGVCLQFFVYKRLRIGKTWPIMRIRHMEAYVLGAYLSSITMETCNLSFYEVNA